MWGGLQAEGYLCKFLHEKRMGGVQTTRTLFHIGECSENVLEGLYIDNGRILLGA